MQPTDVSQCQSFSRDLDAYEAAYTKQHAECLASNKADRPDEAPGSPTCSRSTCQYLHDYLFGDSWQSVKSLKQKLPECYASVKKNQAEAARRAQEEADDEAQQKEQQKQDADQANHRKQERASQDARSREKAEARQRELERTAVSTPSPENGRQAEARPDLSRPTEAAKSTVLVNPFADSGSKYHRKTDDVSNAKIVDPFPATEDLADPFENSSGTNVSSLPPADQKTIFEASSRTIELSTKTAASKLDRDIVRINSGSGITINPAEARQAVAEIKETKSVIEAVSGFVTKAEYAILLKNLIYTDTAAQKQEAQGELGKQIAGDALRSDLVKEGITTIAPRLFGKTVGLVLAGAAPLAIESGGILLDSVKTGRDPSEVIHDSSGKVSLPEKQDALLQMWRGYERMQSQATNRAPNTQLKRELWMNTNIVYRDCVEAGSDCERWKALLGSK